MRTQTLPWQLKHQRRFAAGEHYEQSNPVLRHTQVGAVDNVRCRLIPERLISLQPRRVEHQVGELDNVFDDGSLWPVEFQRRYRGPCRGPTRIVLWTASLFAASSGVALAARRGEQKVMRWHPLPIRLTQVLAYVLGARLIGGMPSDCYRPVVCGPEDIDARVAGTS